MSQSNNRKTENTGTFSKAKKRKIGEENHRSQNTWKLLYFVTQVEANVQCLKCLHTVAVVKDYNIKRHYETTHMEYTVYTGKLSEDKLRRLESAVSKQKSYFTKIKTK